jgi:hypothetical protein
VISASQSLNRPDPIASIDRGRAVQPLNPVVRQIEHLRNRGDQLQGHVALPVAEHPDELLREPTLLILFERHPQIVIVEVTCDENSRQHPTELVRRFSAVAAGAHQEGGIELKGREQSESNRTPDWLQGTRKEASSHRPSQYAMEATSAIVERRPITHNTRKREMWKKVAISAIVALGICNLTATRSNAMIYSPGMGKPGLELRHATTIFEPIRRARVGSKATRGHSRTQQQGRSP